MRMLLSEIAKLVDGILIGDEHIEIRSVAGIEEAQEGDITFIYLPRHLDKVSSTKASAIIVNENVKAGSIPRIKVKDPRWAFTKVLRKFAPSVPKPSVGIDKRSSIGKDVKAGFRHIAGGEIKEYTQLLAEAREIALQRMEEKAEKLNADAVINLRFMTAAIMGGAAEILAYGTAVKLK